MSHKITVFRGDGIGPELVDNVLKILKAADAPLEYEIFNVGEDEWKRNGALIPEEAYASFERTKVLLKSPITTPVGKGFRSLNVTLRGQYDLYANIRPVKSNAAVKTPFKNVDIVIFRENTEGLYVGVEEQVNPDTVHAIKIVTRQASERIIRDAFEYAKKNGRKKVTCIHKANILKMSDGMFLSIFKEFSGGSGMDHRLKLPRYASWFRILYASQTRIPDRFYRTPSSYDPSSLLPGYWLPRSRHFLHRP